MYSGRTHTGTLELTTEDSLQLLGTQEYGRIGIIVDGHPEILPLNYTLDGACCVIFRTTPGTKLAAAMNRHVVFEVDRVNPVAHTGWSVVVHGVAQHTEWVAPGRRQLAPWLEDRPYMVRIKPQSITGRVLGPYPVELRI